MSTSRKDNRGRKLREGESQRKNLTYQYRYTDKKGKRQTIYDRDLQKLREKEATIQHEIESDIDYAAGQITVLELVERYLSLTQGIRESTKVCHDFVLNALKKEDFSTLRINSIKTSDAKLWMIKLHNDGRKYSTLATIRGVMRPAFQMAYDEDVIRKNPFNFQLSDLVSNDGEKRDAMTVAQEHIWMDFIKNDKTYQKYYDEFVVLLNTGLRVSEFCGLTEEDLDFQNRRIRIERQLCRDRHDNYYIERPKTSAGTRFIPMCDEVCQSLKNMLRTRSKVKIERIIDGHKGFIMLDKNGNPKVALHIENEFRWAMHKYNSLHPDQPLPHITPHVFRHTFCTRMAERGMDVKPLQYIMGHSDVSVTLNVYTHTSYDHAAEQMARVLQFSDQKIV